MRCPHAEHRFVPASPAVLAEGLPRPAPRARLRTLEGGRTIAPGIEGHAGARGSGVIRRGGARGVRMADGEAQAAARPIDTPSIGAEREAGKVLYSNYGTPAPTLWRRLFGGVKNAANTSAMTWNGRLFALVET